MCTPVDRLFVFAMAADGGSALSNIGTAGMLGGLLGEALTRLAALLGWEPVADGWREGMFFGAFAFFCVWTFGAMEA